MGNATSGELLYPACYIPKLKFSNRDSRIGGCLRKNLKTVTQEGHQKTQDIVILPTICDNGENRHDVELPYQLVLAVLPYTFFLYTTNYSFPGVNFALDTRGINVKLDLLIHALSAISKAAINPLGHVDILLHLIEWNHQQFMFRPSAIAQLFLDWSHNVFLRFHLECDRAATRCGMDHVPRQWGLVGVIVFADVLCYSLRCPVFISEY